MISSPRRRYSNHSEADPIVGCHDRVTFAAAAPSRGAAAHATTFAHNVEAHAGETTAPSVSPGSRARAVVVLSPDAA